MRLTSYVGWAERQRASVWGEWYSAAAQAQAAGRAAGARTGNPTVRKRGRAFISTSPSVSAPVPRCLMPSMPCPTAAVQAQLTLLPQAHTWRHLCSASSGSASRDEGGHQRREAVQEVSHGRRREEEGEQRVGEGSSRQTGDGGPQTKSSRRRGRDASKEYSSTPGATAVDVRWDSLFSDGVLVNWFPGHMYKASKVIKEKLKMVDVVVEVRDARLPFSSANTQLDAFIAKSNKARLVVFNKSDLADKASNKQVAAKLRREGHDVLFTCGLDGSNVQNIAAFIKKRADMPGAFKTTGVIALVVGMPNVGKSSLINAMRKLSKGKAANRGKKVAKEGARPGVTRQVSSFKISEEPLVHIVDTPGVMVPKVESVSTGLKLALIAAVPDYAVGQALLVEYLLDVLNRHAQARQEQQHQHELVVHQGRRERTDIAQGRGQGRGKGQGRGQGQGQGQGQSQGQGQHTYVSVLGLNGPVESRDSSELIDFMAHQSGAARRPLQERDDISCLYILNKFRDGEFGRVTLDRVGDSG